MTNKAISQTFSLLSKLMDIHGDNDVKAKGFSSLAFTIDRLSSPLIETEREHISKLRGVGIANATLIFELLDTNQLQSLKTLLDKTPSGILELLHIKGIGPKKIATIWHELEIESPGELLYACEENRLVNYKGFGEKSQQSIKEALEFYFANQSRFLFASIEPLANELLSFLQHLFSEENVCITGAFLRQCEIIDELEFVIQAPSEIIFDALSGNDSFELMEDDNDIFTYKFKNMINVVLHGGEEKTYSEKLFFTSGSELFLNAFDTIFPNIDYGSKENESSDLHIFTQANIQYINPCLRESESVIHLAKQNSIPKLIELKDIKGLIHSHSTWSDGKNSIEQMAKACIEKGYEYLVVSDHSVTSFYANGLSVERIYAQHEEIDKLNEKLAPFKIFKSIECDILGDGSLDYDNKTLASFDLVLTSIHQNLQMTEEKAMMRLMGAIENPYTRILCHPTGRLLLSRKEYPINHTQIIEACLKHHVVIELNANPRRLDMDWRWIGQATEAGVMVSINPDAHSIEGIDDNRFGVLVAQKAMLQPVNNLSSMSLHEFEIFLKSKTL